MKRVALVRLSAMGDVVQSLGPALALAAARPDLDVHFVTQSWFAPLLQEAGFASVVTLDRRGGWRAWRGVRAALRGLDLDVAIDLQGNWKSAGITWMSGARTRLGAAAKHRQEPASATLLQRCLPLQGPAHPAAVALALLRELQPDLADRPPVLPATAAEREAAAAAVAAAGVDPSRRFDVHVVGDPADNRSWSAAAMARQAAAATHPVLWLRGPGEVRVPVPSGAPCLDHPRSALRELVGLGAVVGAAGGRVRGGDQGAVHVLAATGAETEVLFGPQDPRRTRPRAAARVLLRRDRPSCVPCRSRRCGHPDGPICMDFTTAESDSA